MLTGGLGKKLSGTGGLGLKKIGTGIGGGPLSTDALFQGYLGKSYVCVKDRQSGMFMLFKRFMNMEESHGPATGQIQARKVFGNNNYGEIESFNKGEYTELRLGFYNTVPIFKKGAKVLCLKRTGPNMYNFVFSPAKIVSGPKECQRAYTAGSTNRGIVRQGGVRHEYSVLFKGDKEPSLVHEEFVVPIEKYWGKEQETYKSESDSDSESSSDSDSSSNSESSSSSSSSEEEKKHKKHTKKSKHHKKDKKHHKHHRHSNKGQLEDYIGSHRVVVIPIFIPYGYNPYI